MSYVAFGAPACPTGWVDDPVAKKCISPLDATQCPPEFKVGAPGECWPATDTACKNVMGTFFNPAEPDRCKQKCPDGTVADSNNVCRPVKAASMTGAWLGIGSAALGAVVLVSILSR